MEEYIEKLRKGVDVSTPADDLSNSQLVPLYTIDPNYASVLDEWARDFPKAPYTKFGTIDKASGSSWSSKESGHETVEVETSWFFGWFKFKHSEEKPWSRQSSGSEQNSIKVKIEAKDVRLFNVSPSIGWDSPGIRYKYPTDGELRDTAKDFVRITQFVCASGVKLTLSVDSKKDSSLFDQLEEAKKTNGSIELLGFQARAGESRGESKETHKATWNKDKGEIIIEPTAVYGTCTLLGAVGEKFQPQNVKPDN